eukprot:CAMPEP_0179338544 /NCGR_PEP_ID=MMETSP0797-20121207/68236_1 /TAXON_ID=47934 /ORGANISM="Dinophysis acuminata, Strain DAEP01" /LENGTH=47 /DNA_ID= /DNA_START= /DNA_END= /DNA_ORIENTATION=
MTTPPTLSHSAYGASRVAHLQFPATSGNVPAVPGCKAGTRRSGLHGR